MKLKYIDKTQKEIRNEEFNDRFAQNEETGSFKLKADSLQSRFNNELNSDKNDFGRHELMEDNIELNIASMICNTQRIKIPGHMSLFEFIKEHKGGLDNDTLSYLRMVRRDSEDSAV
jgi:hypothetical protein